MLLSPLIREATRHQPCAIVRTSIQRSVQGALRLWLTSKQVQAGRCRLPAALRVGRKQDDPVGVKSHQLDGLTASQAPRHSLLCPARDLTATACSDGGLYQAFNQILILKKIGCQVSSM